MGRRRFPRVGSHKLQLAASHVVSSFLFFPILFPFFPPFFPSLLPLPAPGRGTGSSLEGSGSAVTPTIRSVFVVAEHTFNTPSHTSGSLLGLGKRVSCTLSINERDPQPKATQQPFYSTAHITLEAMASQRAWLLLSAALLMAGLCPAASQSCTTIPGPERAACFCQSVTVYKYYADTANGCTGQCCTSNWEGGS